MRIIIILLGVLNLACTNIDKSKGIRSSETEILFKTKEINLGKIKYKKSTTAVFEYENNEENPRIVTKVETSCGCTAPQWCKDALKPKNKEKLKIKFDASAFGQFRKTVKVFYNGSDSPKTLIIKGEVEFPENII